MENERKINMIFITTPGELRNIANMLEKAEVNVNWYHTVITFKNEEKSNGIN